MALQQIEKLKQEYTDKYVAVDAARPELARFKDLVGRVKTVNMSGRALVEFHGVDIGWYDIEIDFLKVVDKPPEKTPAAKAKPAPKKAPPAKQGEKNLSALEMARAQGPAKKEAAAEGEKKMSTGDILAAARAKKAAATTESKAPAGKKTPSTADILAAARGEKQTSTAKVADQPGAEPAAQQAPPVAKPADAKRMSTADILAAARGGAAGQPPSEPDAEAESAEVATEAPSGTSQEPQDEAITAAESETVAEADAPQAEESSAGGAPAPAGELPTTTAEIMAYCRRVDGGG